MRAVIRIRDKPHYRREAFEKGLKSCGFSLVPEFKDEIRSDDVLVVWNRYGNNDKDAARVERLGGKVIVVENGYLGKDNQDRQYYAVALHGHNGSGQTPKPTHDRWKKLKIEIKPWRTKGNHVTVRAQRGIGSAEMASPRNWHADIARKLSKFTKREIKIKAHPRDNKYLDFEAYYSNCWAGVVWASSDAGRLLIRGIPVIYCAPYHVLSGSLSHDISSIETIPTPDNRLETLQRMAWAQWSVDEICQGIPFKCLLEL